MQALGSAAAADCAPHAGLDDKRQIANAPATLSTPGGQQLATPEESKNFDRAVGSAEDDMQE